MSKPGSEGPSSIAKGPDLDGGGSKDVIIDSESEEEFVPFTQSREPKKDASKPNVDPDVSKKRPRGPEDCLDWDESEEEFVPFTQSREPKKHAPEPKKVYAKKSVVKGSGRKKAGKKSKSSKGKFDLSCSCYFALTVIQKV